jgi:hypothetical protein
MARRKHKPRPGEAGGRPIFVSTNAQPTTVDSRLQPGTIGGADVTFFSNDPKIAVVTRLRGPVSAPLPRPRVTTTERPGRSTMTHWAGRDPYVMTLPIQFSAMVDGNVEDEIRAFTQLAIKHPGANEPPVIQLVGPVPTPVGLKNPRWRISGLEEVGERTVYNSAGRRARLALDVTLIEYVVDDLLQETVDENSATGLGKGIKARTTTMHKGESFYDVAQREYHDESRADDIARANGLRPSFVPTKNTNIRLP